MNLSPLGKRVAIVYPVAKEVTDGGIILTGSAVEESKVGVVYAVGGQVEEIEIGDEVVTSGYAGDKIELDGIQYCIVKEEDVIATIKK